MHTCKGNYNNYQGGADTALTQADEKDKGVTLKKFATFTKCIGQISWFSRNWCSNSDI